MKARNLSLGAKHVSGWKNIWRKRRARFMAKGSSYITNHKTFSSRFLNSGSAESVARAALSVKVEECACVCYWRAVRLVRAFATAASAAAADAASKERKRWRLL